MIYLCYVNLNRSLSQEWIRPWARKGEHLSPRLRPPVTTAGGLLDPETNATDQVGLSIICLSLKHFTPVSSQMD